ncbi:MAG: hypothetical protein JRH20_08085 [Deltaproteobacteria bacterium]|nr:hypothetical protein [Deltaproteobacteria bacterium]
MGRRFEADVQHLGEVSLVRLLGVIDEDNELSSLAAHLRGEAVVVDLSAVREINNCGTRDWVRWLENVEKRTEVVLVECSPSVVAKLNMVSNFAGEAYLRSFYVPYYCQDCNEEKALLVDIDEFAHEQPARAPICRCDSCDSVMAFDELEESYFAFLKSARRKLPANVKQLIADVAPSQDERKILSRAVDVSSFASLSTTEGSTSVSAGGRTLSSAAALRRLRQRTGLHTQRLKVESETQTGTQDDLKRSNPLIVGLVVALLLATGGVAALLLLR